MKRELPILLLLLAVFCLGFTAQPRRTVWEYKAAGGPSFGPTELNQFGAEGWELIQVQSNGLSPVYFFKRPK